MTGMFATALAMVFTQSGASPVLVLSQPRVKDYALLLKGFASTHRGVSDEIDIDEPAAIDAASGRSPDLVVALGPKAFEIAKSRWSSAAVIAAAITTTSATGRPLLAVIPVEPHAADALSTLASLAPGAKKVAAFYPATNPTLLGDAKEAAQASHVSVAFNAVSDPSGFQEQFKNGIAGREAAWILPDNRLANVEMFDFLAQTCLQAKIPLIGFNEGMTAAGALASVSVDYKEVGREAARLAIDMGKSKSPGASFRFAAGRITVNEKTMNALGLSGSMPPRAQILK